MYDQLSLIQVNTVPYILRRWADGPLLKVGRGQWVPTQVATYQM